MVTLLRPIQQVGGNIKLVQRCVLDNEICVRANSSCWVRRWWGCGRICAILFVFFCSSRSRSINAIYVFASSSEMMMYNLHGAFRLYQHESAKHRRRPTDSWVEIAWTMRRFCVWGGKTFTQKHTDTIRGLTWKTGWGEICIHLSNSHCA